MKLSVIIPVYNVEKYLRQCFDSVLGQTLRDVEIVCVDDGSSDGSAAILEDYAAKDSRVRVISQSNAGQGAARNRGLEQATGEHVYFMDADDALARPDALARLVEDMGRDRLDVLFFDARTEVDEGVAVSESVVRASDYVRKWDYSSVRTGRELFASFLKNREFCVSPCLMILRRSFVEQNGLRFPEERIFHEDNIFMTRVMLAAKRASHRPWQLYVRKVHQGSTVTSAPTPRHLRGYLACYRDAREMLADGNWSRAVRWALKERRAGYRQSIRRLADANEGLVSKTLQEMTAVERLQLKAALSYPLGERIVNAWRCLRDNGLAYTLRRIVFGRRL